MSACSDQASFCHGFNINVDDCPKYEDRVRILDNRKAILDCLDINKHRFNGRIGDTYTHCSAREFSPYDWE